MKVSLPADVSRPLRKQTTAALTLIEVLVIVMTLSVIAMFALSFVPDRPSTAYRIRCVSNLKQLGISYRLWAGDNDDNYPMALSVTNHGTMETVLAGEVVATYMVMSNELNDPKILVCPKDVERNAATNFASLRNDNLSFFVGIDASLACPQALLSGDRNLTNGTTIRNHIIELTANTPASWTEKIHQGEGNVGLADGSVDEFSALMLRKQISRTGLVTNRFALP